MTTREWLIGGLDSYIICLRILSLQHIGVDRVEDRTTLLAPDWRTVRWYNSLWLFELEGIKASGYPEIFQGDNAGRYAAPGEFVRLASNMISGLTDQNLWRRLPDSAVELDPRYVAYRTIHDWVVLLARVLAERGDTEMESVFIQSEQDSGSREDPFTMPIRTEDEGGPTGLLCGNIRVWLMGGRTGNPWDPSFVLPVWRQVENAWGAIRHFHCTGLHLPMELQYGALREQPDPRLASLDLLTPEVFAAYIADVLCRDDRSLREAWHARSVEDVRSDPRYIAHKCGFDSQIILHRSREANEKRERRMAEVGTEVELEESEVDVFLQEMGIELQDDQDGPKSR
jgi:hypothetical protein